MLALVHTLHPYTFLALAGPMLVLYVRERKALSRNEHAGILAAAPLTVLANLWWLKTALRFWHYILDSGYYLDATPDFVLWDWLAITRAVGHRRARQPQRVPVRGARGVRGRALPHAQGEGRAVAVGEARAPVPAVRGLRRFARAAAAAGAALPLRAAGDRARDGVRGELFDDLAAPIATALRERGRGGRDARRARAGRAPRLLRDVLYFVPDLVPRHKKPLPLAPPNIGGPLGVRHAGLARAVRLPPRARRAVPRHRGLP
ncbi:MAG: hypothetical protein IPJ34_24145 [Myxococcales bacterium]|nr:hypothetical protein [Myxococcales bacterium]